MVFHTVYFYLTTLAAIPRRRTFLYACLLDPYFRRFAGPFGHSNHKHFVDPGPVGSTPHLWGGFVAWRTSADSRYGCSRPLSACFPTPQITVSAVGSRVSVSGRYSVIPPIGLSVLLIKDFVLLLVPVPIQQQERVAHTDTICRSSDEQNSATNIIVAANNPSAES